VTLMTMGLNGLNNRPWWRAKWEKLSVQRFNFATATKRSVANCFDRSWAYFLAWFWGFEGYEHGPRTNARWMTFPCWLFENLECSRKISTSTVSTWLAGKELMLQDRRDSRQGTNLSEISNRPLQRKES
jgi:hypothetical protein